MKEQNKILFINYKIFYMLRFSFMHTTELFNTNRLIAQKMCNLFFNYFINNLVITKRLFPFTFGNYGSQ